MNEFRCYEVKIKESEKAGSHWELNPDTSGLSHQYSAMAVVAQYRALVAQAH